MLVYPANPSYPYILTAAVSAVRDAGPLTGDEIRQFKKDNAPVTGLGQNGYVVTMSLKGVKNQEVVRGKPGERPERTDGISAACMGIEAAARPAAGILKLRPAMCPEVMR